MEPLDGADTAKELISLPTLAPWQEGHVMETKELALRRRASKLLPQSAQWNS
jgi:hypothetical protein